MGLSRAISCFILETSSENEKNSKIPAKIRPVLLAFHKGIHKAKKILATIRQPKRRDWAELHPDLLHLISKKMEDASNLIRFRAVCKGWRSAADAADAPAQLPWFIWPAVPTTLTTSATEWNNEYFVYSLSSNTTRKIRFPLSHKPYLEGSSTGFTLFFEYPSSPVILSPLIQSTVRFRGNVLNYLITWFGHDQNRNSRNITTQFYFVITEQTSQGKTIKIVHNNISSRWRNIKYVSIEFPSGPIAIGYYKGRYFLSLSIPRVTWIYDATTGIKSSVEIPHPNGYVTFDFLIDVEGDFLAVKQFDVGKVFGDIKEIKYHFDVYLLEHTDDFCHCQWSKLNVVDNLIFF